jgi:hypothetical protein
MIQLLHRLGIDRRNLRALPVLPLVEIAWADGHIQPREAALIRKKAEQWGLRGDDLRMLDNWLAHPPSPGYLRSAHTVLGWLRRHGDPALDPTSLHTLLDDATSVAKAAGGLLGFGAICRAERDALTMLTAELSAPVEDVPETGGHPDFVRKNGVVTLAWTDATLAESEGILSPLFDAPMRLPVPTRGLIVGSGVRADVRIVGDPDVHAEHCLVYARGAEGFLVKSLSGPVSVNGERVLERRLLGGETIRATEATSFVFKFVRPLS